MAKKCQKIWKKDITETTEFEGVAKVVVTSKIFISSDKQEIREKTIRKIQLRREEKDKEKEIIERLLILRKQLESENKSQLAIPIMTKIEQIRFRKLVGIVFHGRPISINIHVPKIVRETVVKKQKLQTQK